MNVWPDESSRREHEPTQHGGEGDPLRSYASAMLTEHAPADLAERVKAQIAAPQAAPPAAQRAKSSVAQQQATPASTRRKSQPAFHAKLGGKAPRRWALAGGMAAAVCLAAAFGIAGFAGLPFEQQDDPNAPSFTSEPKGDFSPLIIRAYANDTAPLPLLDERTVVFESAPDFTYPTVGENWAEQGAYLDCLFGVAETDTAVTRVEISVDRGELYRYEGQNVSGNFTSSASCTRLGASAVLEAPFDEGGKPEQMRFGLWTSNQPNSSEPDIFKALYDQFDGARLTIAVSYADGTSETQVIELASAAIKAQFSQNAEGIVSIGEPLAVVETASDESGLVSEEEAAQGIGIMNTLIGRLV